MDNFEAILKKNTVLVNVDNEGKINASFVTYSEYGGYIWIADADTTKMQLDDFPVILNYLQHSCSSLELGYLNGEMIAANIISMKRDVGYKETLQRVVEYNCKGDECLNNLEDILTVELKSENQIKNSLGKMLFKKMVPSKDSITTL